MFLNLKESSYIKFLIKRHFKCVDSKSNFQPSECEEMCVFHLPTFCLTLNNCIEHYQGLLTLLMLVMSKWSQVQCVKGATRMKKFQKTLANDDLHIFEQKITRVLPYSLNYTESLQLHRLNPTILTIP